MKKEDMKTIPIHGNPYVQVNERLLYFNDNYPNGSIVTELMPSGDDRFIFKTIVTPDIKNPDRVFVGWAEEVKGSSQINNTSALENCETSSLGRSLAKMGIGILHGCASADEVANAIHQQNGQPKVNKSTTNATKTDYKCPLCGQAVLDNTLNGELQVSPKGNNFPAWKCSDNDDFTNPKCKFASWKLDPVEAGILTLPVIQSDDLGPNVAVDDDTVAEADKLALQAEDAFPIK